VFASHLFDYDVVVELDSDALHFAGIKLKDFVKTR
jgi:hypothetical protein